MKSKHSRSLCNPIPELRLKASCSGCVGFESLSSSLVGMVCSSLPVQRATINGLKGAPICLTGKESTLPPMNDCLFLLDYRRTNAGRRCHCAQGQGTKCVVPDCFRMGRMRETRESFFGCSHGSSSDWNSISNDLAPMIHLPETRTDQSSSSAVDWVT